jgi:hypothetical protein
MRLLPPLPNEETVDVHKDDINRLLFESYKKCESSAEEVMVLKELAKINGHYEKSVTTQINVLNIKQNMKQLGTLSDEELLEFVSAEDGNMFALPEPVKVVQQVNEETLGDEADEAEFNPVLIPDESES